MIPNLFQTQYTWIQESRTVVFQFLENQVKEGIHQPTECFNGKTIAYFYLHIANTYIAWAGNFALGDSAAYYDQDMAVELREIKIIYEGIDDMMRRYGEHFSTDPDKKVNGYKWPGKYIETDAFGIFTHVITHEFHHKGQAMTMARLLGHVPPDTDVMRF